jgi:type I restriction enzyme R subunit
MPALSPEKRAREQIDAFLAASGWVVQDYRNVDLSAGRGVALREVPLKSGPCDYLLVVDRTPVGVVEAKKAGAKLSTVAEQSARYSVGLPDFLAAGRIGPIPFLYESTGIETFFRDSRDPHPRSRRVFSFHRPETLGEWFAEPDTLRARGDHRRRNRRRPGSGVGAVLRDSRRPRGRAIVRAQERSSLHVP